MGEERFLKELDQVAARLFAGRQRGPDAFTPLTALLAARALGDFAVEYHEPNCLFGQIIGRIDARRGDDLEERGAVLAKPVCHVLRLARGGNPAGRLGEHNVPGGGQTTFDRSLGEFVAAMKRVKHFADRHQQAMTGSASAASMPWSMQTDARYRRVDEPWITRPRGGCCAITPTTPAAMVTWA